MDDPKTPVRNKNLMLHTYTNKIAINPSKFFKHLGYGTGVDVYEMVRSPCNNKVRSPWAIKIVNEHVQSSVCKSRLKYEADVLRRLNHPNVVVFKAFTKSTDGNECLAMEECDCSLSDLIEKRFEDDLGPFEAPTVLKVASDISKALDYLHNVALILHGDIKSHNVLIKGNFEICKLCDFGVCLPITKEGDLDLTKAEEPEYVGTHIYSAPEIVDIDQIITSKADIFSFGLVLWEMLSLQPPYCDEEETEAEIIEISDEDMETSKELKQKLRPPLPGYDFDKEYSLVLELFYCCTHENYKLRPSASDIVSILNSTQ